MAQKKQSFEQAMKRLEEIVLSLEKGDAPLQDALKLFEEGAGLLRRCTEQLEQAEQKVALLQKGADGTPEETPFAGEESRENTQ